MASKTMKLRRLESGTVLKDRVYGALKKAIAEMDIYASMEPPKLDERRLAESLGVSRTPIREALLRLEQEGLVMIVPRRGAFVARKTRKEVLEMIQVWAALESMAARLATERASDQELARLRGMFATLDEGATASARIDEYSDRNIEFHQQIIRLSHSDLLISMAASLFVHMRWIRAHTIGENDRATRSVIDHMNIIEALEARDVEVAGRLVRDHTLGLARHVEDSLAFVN
jgi:DNA-binding GntR family transcriptional regulator